MDLPEHVIPGIDGRRGKAPYNFVPLPEAIYEPPGEPFKAHDRLDSGRLHGFIDLDITTETELYTRSAYPPAEEYKEVQRSRLRQAFYHHSDEDREAFRSEIVAHHNARARDPLRVSPDADLWEIPRLQALRYLLDWEHRPPRQKTDYIRDLKTFRARQVLPAPAAVLGRPEPKPAALRMPDRPQPNSPSDIITETPVLQELQTLLQDTARTQRQRLEAIDEALCAQLEALADERRRCAWDMIRWSIGVNKKTRDRLQALERRLRGDRT